MVRQDRCHLSVTPCVGLLQNLPGVEAIYESHAQRKELTGGPPELHVHSSALSFIGGVHIGARALHVIKLLWFGKISL
jgi:hypothetical protein